METNQLSIGKMALNIKIFIIMDVNIESSLMEKNVHIRTFFQKDRILKIFVSCPFFFEKWLLTHVWAGIRVKNPPVSRLVPGSRPFAPDITNINAK